MIECFKTTAEGTRKIDTPEEGCWISVVAPNVEERSWLMNELGIVPEFVSAALDDDERSRTDYDDDTHQAIIIVDCPFIEDESEAEDTSITQYDTHPLSLLFLPEEDIIVTVTLRENKTVNAFYQGRRVNTNQRTRLLLQMMLHISHGYVTYLRNIERQFNDIEKKMRESLRNEELIKMLGFEKSLVYFSTSLKSIESVVTRISTGRFVKLYEDDRDLLDDVLIEVRQAIEMATILTRVLNGTMDTFGSVISNRLNSTLRILAIITLVLAIPTIVFSFFGMNVEGLPFIEWPWFPFAVSVVLCVISVLFIKFSKLFK